MYCILDTSRAKQKYVVVPAEDARHLLRIHDHESLRNMQSQYLINVSKIFHLKIVNMYNSFRNMQARLEINNVLVYFPTYYSVTLKLNNQYANSHALTPVPGFLNVIALTLIYRIFDRF